MKNNVLKIMIGSIIVEVLLICIFILFKSFNYRAIFSVGIIFAHTIPCLFYSKIYDNYEYRFIAVIGSILAFVSCLIQILFLWNVITVGIFLTKLLLSLRIIMAMLAIVSLTLSFNTQNRTFILFKKITNSLLIILSLYINIVVWLEISSNNFLLRLFLILLVLTTGSLACTFILAIIHKNEKEEHAQKLNNQVYDNSFNNQFSNIQSNNSYNKSGFNEQLEQNNSANQSVNTNSRVETLYEQNNNIEKSQDSRNEMIVEPDINLYIQNTINNTVSNNPNENHSNKDINNN